jgi:hypothetical protein
MTMAQNHHGMKMAASPQQKSKFWRNNGFWFKWGALFIAGIAGLESGITALQILGILIVAPSLIAVALMAYGWILWKIVEGFGGDPREGWFGVVVFISFCFFFALFANWFDHHH